MHKVAVPEATVGRGISEFSELESSELESSEPKSRETESSEPEC